MRLQDHLGKITWTVLDKGLFIVYGLIRMIQVSRMKPDEFGLFALLDALMIAIATLSDSFSLQSVVRYGPDTTLRPQINTLALLSHIGLSMGLALLIYFFRIPLSAVFSEPRLAYVGEYLPLLCLLNIPRGLFIKVLLRDTRMGAVFATNGAWFGTMIGITLWFIYSQNTLSLSDMVWITGCGTGASALTGLFLALKNIDFSRPERSTIRIFFNFGIYQVAWTIPSTIMKQLDLYIIQFFFGTVVVGIFQSAKTLFRFFEALVDGIGGLYYPAFIRLKSRNDLHAMRTVTAKMLSFSILFISSIVLVLEAGVGKWAVDTLLSTKYSNALGHFQILMLGACYLPLITMAIVYIALDDMPALLRNSIISCAAGLLISVIIGIMGAQDLVALGTLTYNLVFSVLGLRFAAMHGIFAPKDLFRAIPDIYYFLRKKQAKQS
jgi:O-antigen/teichoic acid export membrane protein